MTNLNYINATDATVSSPLDARAILDAIQKAAAGSVSKSTPLHLYSRNLDCGTTSPDEGVLPKAAAPKFDAKDFYCLIHVLLWKNPDSTNAKAIAVDKQNWFVYHAGNAWRLEDFNSRNRVFGSKNLWLLFVYINSPSSYKYEIRYEIDMKDVTPAPINDLLALAGVVSGGGGQAAGEKQTLWGMYPINVTHLPNQISIQSEVYGPDSSDTLTLQKTGASPPTFVNEGRYHYDFGIAVPVKGISQTTVSTSNGTISPKSTSTQNAFAVADLYPFPNDVRNTTFSPYPYLIGGVATASQPLHKILMAVGWGPAFTQFYVGALLVKQQSVATSTKPQHSSYEPQFSLGINLSVKAFNGLLKKSK
ncbi:MAG TPA: hypothetical protein VGF44_08500 [Terriglobales bacterium]